MSLGFGLGLQYSKLSGGGFEGLLNKFSGASLGLSLDKLDINYTGSAIKVRRSSDNNELDIGFVDGILDTASLLDFVGSGDAFVTIIYDQVGSNNMYQTTANLQGQIVSNGSVILKNGKPCIIRSVNDSGGYKSTYAPNDGATVKGFFYVGDNGIVSGNKAILITSNNGAGGFFLATEDSSTANIKANVTADIIKINGTTITFNSRQETFNATIEQFLLYAELGFNFANNTLAFGFDDTSLGMFTFQELVIFENTDDVVAKENNVNSRYNIY